jgi:histone acetyltransferase (RNA polymerase elongator complex component)
MPNKTKKKSKRQAKKKTKKNIFRFDAAKIHPASIIIKKYIT